MELAHPVGKTKNVSSCRFDADRLHVDNWRAALADDDRRSALLAELTLLLTPAVTNFLPEPMQLSKGPNAVARWVSAQSGEGDVFCVRDGETQDLLGLLILVGFEEPDGVLTVRLGYLLAENAWGKGIATELVKGFVHWCEEQDFSIQLLGGVEKENGASTSVLIKAGFEKAADLSTDQTETFRLNV